MSRYLADLCPRLRPLAAQALGELIGEGFQPWIVDTLRTKAEHAANVAKGTSWTKRSKHLARTREECSDCGHLANSQGESGLSHAIDAAPLEVWQAHGPDKLAWDPEHPFWSRLGAIGERLGLGWGGRWEQRDLGHLELRS